MGGKSDSALFYAVWATAWGLVGAVACDKGIRRIVLPHYQSDDLADLLEWEHPGCTRNDAPFAALMRATRDYFNAARVDFDEIVCELPKESTFAGKVLRACRGIAYGRTRSYGQLARQIGREDAARAVAAALGKNPLPLVVPCHRVTYADGRPGGFSAPGGVEQKRRLLALERRVCRPSH